MVIAVITTTAKVMKTIHAPAGLLSFFSWRIPFFEFYACDLGLVR